jgi:hypothetical protein
VDAKKVLLAVVAALLLLVGAGFAYASNSAPDNTSTGERGAQQVAGGEDANEAGEVEDADEPGDFDGPGDTEDAD